MCRCRAFLLVSLALLGLPSLSPAADRPPPDKYEHFFSTVRPLLESKCVGCHGPDKPRGGLRLDSATGLHAGGDGGPVVIVGKPDDSPMLHAVRHADGKAMPPKEKLNDEQVAALARWIRDGCPWPEPVRVLFEDHAELPAALTEGTGEARLEAADRHRGSASLLVTPQKFAPSVPGWSFRIRERPSAEEYRYIRFTWKKRGGGGLMFEVARNGDWRKQGEPNGSWVAGANSTGWPAHVVSANGPAQWTTVTRDLWKDGGSWGDFAVTGLCITAIDGGEALLDSIILGPTLESLDAYQPGRGISAFAPVSTGRRIGDVWHDEANPIRTIFAGKRLDLWSLRPVGRPELPAVRDEKWCRNPVDRFVLARLEGAGLTPSPEADRRTLIRRLTFDLIGLPPTPEEVRAFEADTRADAYERLIDRLLASPRYGERWGRHWLDVVRYADTNGFEWDEWRPNIWRYRDYVIRALNSDKPFDQFVREQLAGDELPGAGPDRLVATGFLRLGPVDNTRALFQEEAKGQDEWMSDLTNTTGSAFLGLTVSCCQCHDHKYDPLSQADHYRLRAFFAGVKAHDHPLGTGKTPELATGVIEDKSTPPPTFLLAAGDFTQPKDEVAPGFLSVFDPNPAAVPPGKGKSSGRRLALAKWLTSPEQPLTARVFANRVWQGHFGRGIVATPNDFGYSGTRPTHPELLDWLASEFMLPSPPTSAWVGEGPGVRGAPWSVKKLHRLIVTSAAYRQISRDDAARRTLDPDNALLWRQNVQRLPAEAVRDALLAVSGKLLPEADGKPRWPEMPADLLDSQPSILETRSDKAAEKRLQGWYPDPPEKVDVRSIFLIQKRTLPIPLLQAFDLPDSNTSCGRRGSTVVAPQALALLNGPDTVRLSRALAERVAREAGADEAKRIERAVWLTLGRGPSPEEVTIARELLRRNRAIHGEGGATRALADLCRALVNGNEFITVD